MHHTKLTNSKFGDGSVQLNLYLPAWLSSLSYSGSVALVISSVCHQCQNVYSSLVMLVNCILYCFLMQQVFTITNREGGELNYAKGC